MHSYTLDEADEVTTLVVLRTRDESDPATVRVLQEEAHLQAGTHSLREGGFTTLTKALDWCNAAHRGRGRDPAARPEDGPIQEARDHGGDATCDALAGLPPVALNHRSRPEHSR